MECMMNKDSQAVLCATHGFENVEHYQHWIGVHDFHEWNDIYQRKIPIRHGFDHTIPKLYLMRLLPFEFEWRYSVGMYFAFQWFSNWYQLDGAIRLNQFKSQPKFFVEFLVCQDMTNSCGCQYLTPTVSAINIPNLASQDHTVRIRINFEFCEIHIV